MSWYLRQPAAPAATARATRRAVAECQPAPTERITQTSGLFEVPEDVQGIPNSLHVFLSSHLTNDSDVSYAINRLSGTGAKQTVAQGEVNVPAGGVVETQVHGVMGDTFEVNVSRPDGVLPSAVAIETFPADAATRLLVTVPAGDFDTLAADTPLTPPFGGLQFGVPGQERLSTGFVAVPQGVASQRPVATLLLSNFTGSDLDVNVTVNGMTPGSTFKDPILNQDVPVPAFAGIEMPLENVEGRAIEVLTQVPIGTEARRLVEPSLSITETDTTDNSTQLVAWISPDDFVPV